MNRKRISKKTRQRVYEKYGGRCAYCGQKITYNEMQVEHREPLALGGADSLENYMPSCRICNHYKHTLTVDGFRDQIGRLTTRLRARAYIYNLAIIHGRVAESDTDVTFYFERVPEFADVEEHLQAEQHRKLEELLDKLNGVLYYEPADSGDEEEDDIWKQANLLKDMLDDFFEGVGGCS